MYRLKIDKKENKYKNTKTIYEGIKFDSKGEMLYYMLLKHQEKCGIIKDIELQPRIYLSQAKILYKPDFKYIRIEKNQIIYADFKGMKTPVFNLKARLWKAYMDCPLELIVKSGRHFKLDKRIEGTAKLD